MCVPLAWGVEDHAANHSYSAPKGRALGAKADSRRAGVTTKGAFVSLTQSIRALLRAHCAGKA